VIDVPERTCSVDGCAQPHKARGYCSKHYQRFTKFGDPLKVGYTQSPPQCIVDGCAGVVLARGWCRRHYYRWSTHGDPLAGRAFARPHPERCTVDGCEKPHFCQDFCSGHYARWKKHGDPNYVPFSAWAEQRFWPQVDKSGPPSRYRPDLGPCWLWLGPLNRHGYGIYSNKRTHRIAYELLVGAVPRGLELDHLCRVRNCCNPAHLEAVTHQVNAKRGAEARAAGY
jgi:hypothetical protein